MENDKMEHLIPILEKMDNIRKELNSFLKEKRLYYSDLEKQLNDIYYKYTEATSILNITDSDMALLKKYYLGSPPYKKKLIKDDIIALEKILIISKELNINLKAAHSVYKKAIFNRNSNNKIIITIKL